MHEGPTREQLVAAWILFACGASLVGIGLYFAVWRPPLLPEDVRSIGMSLSYVARIAPGLAGWLQKVFWVLGGYVLSTGLFTVYLAATSLRTGRVPVAVFALAGLTSVGWMALVNFVIDSDSKWPLLGLAVLWGGALAVASSGSRARCESAGPTDADGASLAGGRSSK
jgi:hypothetical protein